MKAEPGTPDGEQQSALRARSNPLRRLEHTADITGLLFGPLGAIVGGMGAFAHVSEQEDVAYGAAMKECLQEKGHDLD